MTDERRLLDQDQSEIRLTKGRAWQPRKTGYTAEDFRRDQARRRKQSKDPGRSQADGC